MSFKRASISPFLIGTLYLLLLCLSFQPNSVVAAPLDTGVSQQKPNLPETPEEAQALFATGCLNGREAFFYTALDTTKDQLGRGQARLKAKNAGKGAGMMTLDDVWTVANPMKPGTWANGRERQKFLKWADWASNIYARHAAAEAVNVWVMMPTAADRKSLDTSVWTKQEWPEFLAAQRQILFWEWDSVPNDPNPKPDAPDAWWTPGQPEPPTRADLSAGLAKPNNPGLVDPAEEERYLNEEWFEDYEWFDE